MTYNPAFDPRNEGDERNQQRIDEQYRQQISNSQPVYNQPVSRTPAAVTQVNTSVATRPYDDVRWGPILAGLISTLATLLLLSILGVAVGLTAATADPNGGANAAAGRAGSYGTGAAIWAAVSALLAFLIGGYVAGRTAGVRRRGYGWVNGALVWAITLPLLLWLAGSGASGFLNAIGFNLAGFTGSVGAAVNNAANDPAAVQNTTEGARNGAWGALAALLLGLLAAGLGGLLGSRNRYEVDDDAVTR